MMKQGLYITLIGSLLAVSACQKETSETGALSEENSIVTSDEESQNSVMSTAEAMAALTDNDWRDLDQDNTLYMTLESGGQLVIELAPQFAPNHVSNIKTLVQENYFDGLWVIRSHDNYVAQWGDPSNENPRPLGSASATLDPEWESEWPTDLAWTELPDGDIYQDNAGYAYGFPVAGDKKSRKIGMAHCYGMVGVGRGNEIDSGNGSSLYMVTGHSPRHLDRNVTLVGRAWIGMEHLSSLPRGTEALGFYATPEEYTQISSVRLGSDLPPEHRENLQILRTDTPAFSDYVAARRYRTEDWFVDPAGHIELCNVPMPTRQKPQD